MSEVKKMQASRDFGVNTCPASRHTQMIAEALCTAHSGSTLSELYPMLEEEPEHCAASIASVVNSLYQARSFLRSLGYEWTVENNTVIWRKEDPDPWYEGRAARNNMSNPGDKDYDV